MRMAKLLWMVCLLLALCALLPLAAHAGTIDRLWVWDDTLGEVPEGTTPGYAIHWYVRGSSHYILLPAGMDANNLRVVFSGYASQFTCNGVTVKSGDVTDVFQPGSTLTIQNGPDAYTVRVMQSANLASVHLTTQSGNIDYISEKKTNREPGFLYLITEDGRLAYDKEFEYIHTRGNFSFYPNKKSYHIKLNSGFSMLGMGKSKTWLLLANFKDCSLLRNAITLDMAAAAGLEYTSQYRFVDVYMNRLYVGTYMLTERVQEGENRVAINDLQADTQAVNKNALESAKAKGVSEYKKGTIKYLDINKDPADITGGYLMQLELSSRYRESDCGFTTANGQAVQLKEPEFASKAQVEYISAIVQSFENAISASDGVDPATGKHYTQIADMDSLVRKYLVEEVSKNLDANKSSFYVYKHQDSVSDKLFFGPVWDYDNAYGNYISNYYKRTLLDPQGLFAAADDFEKYYWFPLCYQHADFRQAAVDVYRTDFLPSLEVLLGLRPAGADTGNIRSLDDYQALLSASAAMNFTRWRLFDYDMFGVMTGSDYQENVDTVRNFIAGRMAYLNELWLDE